MKPLITAVSSALLFSVAALGPAVAADNSGMTNTPTAVQGSNSLPPNNDQGNNDQGTQANAAPVKLSEPQLKQVQQQLKAAGLYNGAIDGRMGPETKQAVQQFQQQNGLQATGTIDHETVAALQNHPNATTGTGSSTMNQNQTNQTAPPQGNAGQ
jgi:peptidoglycan hydrolase-like protein with peptidoglycan-binding domain